jgi:hypothetical protein
MLRVLRIAVAVLVAGYFVLLLSNACFFAAGPDSSGYLSEARLLAAGRMAVPVEPLVRAGLDPSLVYLFTPYGFRAAADGTAAMVPTYPVGTSVHLAIARIAGEKGPFVVGAIAAVLSLFLFVAVAREFGVTRGWAIAGAVLLAAYPVFILQSLQAMSDVPATLWALITMLCALKAREGGWRWAVACGVAFSIGVAVRPTSILLAIPIVMTMPRKLVTAGAAAMPVAIALMWYHDALYGSPFMTGYGGAGSIVSLTGLPPCFSKHSVALMSLLTPLVFPGGLLVAFDRRLEVWRRATLLTWFGVFFGFYSYYSYCPDAVATRFLLPALPPLIIGFLRVAEWAVGKRRLLATAAILIVLGREVVQIGRMHVLHIDDWESIFPKTVEWVERNVPENAVVLSAIMSGAFYAEEERITVRWDQLEPHTAALLQPARGFEGPWYAVVSEVDGGVAALRQKVPGEWQEVWRIRDVTVWQRIE